jgi:dipeptidyl aminopeptidase/acylaminoacyl peptidase
MRRYKKRKQVFSYEYWRAVIGAMGRGRRALKNISPCLLADSIQVPVYLFHGESDSIVPCEHTSRFVEALEKRNKRYQVKIFAKEDHSIDSKNNAAYIVDRAAAFFRGAMKE